VGLAALALAIAACEPGEPPKAARDAAEATAPADARATAAPAGSSAVTAIAAGGAHNYASYSHTCAVVDGGLQCWGAGESGQLGDGVLGRRSPRPVTAYAPGEGVAAVAAGGVHTCVAVRGRVACWGGNWNGQLGVPRPYLVGTPAPVPLPVEAITRVGAGARDACAATEREIWCWGGNEAGESGPNRCGEPAVPGCSTGPQAIPGIDGRVAAIALGRAHSCAQVDGRVVCWGAGERGQLGISEPGGRAAPVAVEGLPDGVSLLAVGADHGCAAAGAGVWCWGANAAGQLGDGSTTDRQTATALPPFADPVTALAAGEAHTCAATRSGVWCWGGGARGQLGGRARPEAQTHPVAVPSFGSGAVALAAGVDHTCAVRPSGTVTCFGDDDFGQLGDGAGASTHGPTDVLAWDDRRLRDRNGDGRIAIACLGDSNTQPLERGPRKWCEILADLAASRGWRVVNRAEGGATAVRFGSLITGDEQLEYALREDAVDAVILAYGTNDVRLPDATTERVMFNYTSLWRRAYEAGVDVFAALTPPTRSNPPETLAAITHLNTLLQQTFPPSRVIDFFSGVAETDFDDELHLGAAGQRQRAERAYAVLAAAAEGR